MECKCIIVKYGTHAKSLCKKAEKVIIDRIVNSDYRDWLLSNLWNCYYFYSSNESRLKTIGSFLRSQYPQTGIMLIYID
jgi:hypothetical protein